MIQRMRFAAAALPAFIALVLLAVWTGAVPATESFGVDQRGEPYGVTLLDGPGGGAGARSTADGVDTGGLIRTISVSSNSQTGSSSTAVTPNSFR